MGATLKRVRPGDPLHIRAADWNSVLAATEAVHGGKNRPLGGGLQFTRTTLVDVRNDTEDDLLRISVLGIDGPILTPQDDVLEFQTRVCLAGVTPDRNDHFGKFVVLLEPIRSGAIGKASIAGVLPAWIDVVDEDHPFADVKHASTELLQSREDGAAQILWKEEGTGEKWAIVLLGPARPAWYWASLTEDLESGGSAAATLHQQDPVTGGLGATVRTVTVFCPVLPAGYKIPSGAKLKVEVHGPSGLWNVTFSNTCPEPIA